MIWWSFWKSGVPNSAYRMTTGASGLDPEYLWSPLKRYGFGLKERQWSQLEEQSLFYWFIALLSESYCVFNYLSGAVFSSAAKLSASHVFSPWTLKNAEHPEGGGSLDAIWKQEQQHVSHTVKSLQHSSHAWTSLQTRNQIILLVPVGRSALLQSRLSGRGKTSACSPGQSWARHWLSSKSGHSRPDLCLREDNKHKQK